MMLYRMIAVVCGGLLVVGPAQAPAQRPPQSPQTDTLHLSLAEAVTLGLRSADEVRLSAAQADIADAQVDVARASLLPQLRLSSTFGRTFENARSAAVNPVFSQTNTYSANANVTQTLFQGGRLVANARAASSLARASRLNADEQRALFTVTIQRAYLGALLAERMVELQGTNLQLASARLAQVEQFLSAGQAAQYDVLRARVERANIEPAVIQARNDADLAYLDLKRLLNLPLNAPLRLTTTVDPEGAQALVAAVIDTGSTPQRAAVRSAELVARSRQLAVTAARADFLPTVTASFQTGYGAFPPAGFGIPSTRGFLTEAACPPGSVAGRQCQNGGWFEDRSLNVQFSWPVFDGLRAKSALELARAQTRIANLELRQEQEQVAVEVARARAELQRARAVFSGRRQTASEADEAFRLASLRFSRGLSTQLEVSDAQLALLTAESGEARATFDLYLAAAELARALGRPIPLPPETPTSSRRTDD